VKIIKVGVGENGSVDEASTTTERPEYIFDGRPLRGHTAAEKETKKVQQRLLRHSYQGLNSVGTSLGARLPHVRLWLPHVQITELP